MESEKKVGESHVIDQIENKMLIFASLSLSRSKSLAAYFRRSSERVYVEPVRKKTHK